MDMSLDSEEPLMKLGQSPLFHQLIGFVLSAAQPLQFSKRASQQNVIRQIRFHRKVIK